MQTAHTMRAPSCKGSPCCLDRRWRGATMPDLQAEIQSTIFSAVLGVKISEFGHLAPRSSWRSLQARCVHGLGVRKCTVRRQERLRLSAVGAPQSGLTQSEGTRPLSRLLQLAPAAHQPVCRLPWERRRSAAFSPGNLATLTAYDVLATGIRPHLASGAAAGDR